MNTKLYQSLFRKAQDAFILESEDGRIIEANDAACQLFGYSRDELLNRSLSSLKKTDDSGLHNAVSDSSNRTVEAAMILKSGSVIIAELSVTPLKIGESTIFMSIIRDITERKNREKALLHQSHILNVMTSQMEDMVYLKDSQFRYIFCSKPYSENILKCSQKACIGKTDTQISPLSRPSVYIEGMGEVLVDSDLQTKNSGKPSYFTEIIRIDGKPVYLEVLKTPLFDKEGRFAGIVGSSRNVTERIQAEQKMMEQQALLRCLVDSIPASVYLKDKFQKYQAVNKAFAESIGRSIYEISEKTDFDLFSKEEAKERQTTDYHILKTGKPIFNVEESTVMPSKETKWFMTTKVPYRDEDNHVVGMVGIRLDITDRKRAEEELRRRDRILQAIAFAAATFLKTPDWENNVTEVLESLGKAAGVTRVYIFENQVQSDSALTMHRRFEWIDTSVELRSGALKLQKLPYQQGGVGRWEKSLSKGEALYGHVKNFPPGEQKILSLQGVLSFAIVPIFEGGSWWGFIGFDDCFREREWTQAEIDILKAAADTLGAAIHRKKVEDTLRKARDEAEQANMAKSQFIASISHEVRTPMNAIINLTDLVLKTELTSRQQHLLGRVSSSSRALLGILNDILDFSKIEAGKMTVEKSEFMLQNVLDDLIDLFGHQSSVKGIEMIVDLSPDVPTALIGDAVRLKQILINLTGNAVKFTESGVILISITCVQKSEKDAAIRFSVTDTGIGISKETMEHLFLPFSQGDGSTTRKYGGTGLGLAISKRLLDHLGGVIQVESEVGKGSTFSFTISFEIQPGDDFFLTTARKEIPPFTILIADDNQIVAHVIKQMLKSIGCEAAAVNSGKEALDVLQSQLTAESTRKPFDIMILDAKMPEMDGYETVKRLRENIHLFHIPIILMIPFGTDESYDAEDLVVNAHLMKPVKLITLVHALKDVANQIKEQKDGAAIRNDKTLIKTNDPKSENLNMAKGESINILLAEDDRVNQILVTEILKQAGVTIDIAKNGIEAVDAIRSGKEYHLILMDIQMPEMDGYEAATRIRQLEQNEKNADPSKKPIPIIAMTGHSMSEELERFRLAGIDDGITKPMENNELISMIYKWTQQSKPDQPLTSTNEHPAPIESNLPGIDMTVGILRVRGNRDLFIKLLNQFTSNYSNIVNDIRSKLADQPACKLLIHTLKGTASNLSLTDVHTITYDLEIAYKNNEYEKTADLLNQLDRALAVVKTSVAALNQSFSNKLDVISVEKPVLDISAIKPVLISFSRLLDENNIEAEFEFETLKKSLSGAHVADELRKLEHQISSYDFKEAKNTFQVILKKINTE